MSWVFGIFLFGTALVTLLPRGLHIWDLSRQLSDLEAKKEALLQVQTVLRSEQENMEKPETVERLAREKLGLVKPGERIILEIDP
jgi:cell division protein FtsB